MDTTNENGMNLSASITLQKVPKRCKKRNKKTRLFMWVKINVMYKGLCVGEGLWLPINEFKQGFSNELQI